MRKSRAQISDELRADLDTSITISTPLHLRKPGGFSAKGQVLDAFNNQYRHQCQRREDEALGFGNDLEQRLAPSVLLANSTGHFKREISKDDRLRFLCEGWDSMPDSVCMRGLVSRQALTVPELVQMQGAETEAQLEENFQQARKWLRQDHPSGRAGWPKC